MVRRRQQMLSNMSQHVTTNKSRVSGLIYELIQVHHQFFHEIIIQTVMLFFVLQCDVQWFAMKFPDVAIYLDTARECYEAYVIYNFMSYLLVFLRREHENLEYELEQKIQITHLPPICCLPPWKMGRLVQLENVNL